MMGIYKVYSVFYNVVNLINVEPQIDKKNNYSENIIFQNMTLITVAFNFDRFGCESV